MFASVINFTYLLIKKDYIKITFKHFVFNSQEHIKLRQFLLLWKGYIFLH